MVGRAFTEVVSVDRTLLDLSPVALQGTALWLLLLAAALASLSPNDGARPSGRPKAPEPEPDGTLGLGCPICGAVLDPATSECPCWWSDWERCW